MFPSEIKSGYCSRKPFLFLGFQAGDTAAVTNLFALSGTNETLGSFRIMVIIFNEMENGLCHPNDLITSTVKISMVRDNKGTLFLLR